MPILKELKDTSALRVLSKNESTERAGKLQAGDAYIKPEKISSV